MINKDALEYEYRDVQEQMRGISPKLALHAQLQVRLDEIKAILGREVPPKKTANQQHNRGRKRYFSAYHKV